MEVKSIGKADFDTIYNENADRIYRIAVKYTGKHHIAEELMQSVFLKLYVNMDNVEVEAARAWLILTTKYMALNYNRDHNREYPVEELAYNAKSYYSGSLEDPADLFLEKIKERQYISLKEDIFDALYKKNPRWYEAVTITYVLGKPQKEVAKNMGITVEVLHSMLYRAKQWIRDNYAEEYAHLHKE